MSFFAKYRNSWYSLFSCGGGSEDYVFGISVYGNPYYNTGLFKATVMPAYRVGRKLNDLKYWLLWRFHPEHQYNIIRTGLKPGYYDEDTLILHGCFALLGRYIESNGGMEDLDRFSQELRLVPDPHSPVESRRAQADRQTEATKLWRWWTIERPADQKREEELLMRLYGNRELNFSPVTEGPGAGKFTQLEPLQFTDEEEVLEAEYRALEAKIAADEQRMLHLLIDIRPSLWT